MGVFARLYYTFAPYTDARERQVARFFARLREHSSQASTRAQLLELLQQHIAVINLWTEAKYKGYSYLTKSERKKLYANLERITADFDRFLQQRTASESDKRRDCIAAMMEYFRSTYTYRESSTFGRLLRDPAHEQLVGDCNQIVTLYIHLYSQYFDVRDLKLRLLPGHVALHYNGQDIEATNGTFADYTAEASNQLVPIEEIVSINLLDVTDETFAVHTVSPQDFLQSTRLAYIVSHDRDIVAKNLDAAYVMIVNQLMARSNYARALDFAKQSKAVDLLAVVGHNGAVYHIQHYHFAAARTFAHYALKRSELMHESYQAEGAHYYQQKKFTAAIKAFTQAGDKVAVRQCYEALFFEAQARLPRQLTSDTVSAHKKTIATMREYAKKSGNKQLVQHVDQLRKHL